MKIAISSLIKNEMKFIEKYLEKNKDADYICLLDTGSTDGTWEFLQKEANKNSKLIIQQKIYDDFRFDIARNDSIKLIPDDTNIIIFLDLDEYFSDDNWREIIDNNIKITNEVELYSTYYKDGSDFSLNGIPRMIIANRIVQTKNIRYFHCVHECLADSTWENNGFKKQFSKWNKLLIIHEPDKTKSRKSYVELCKKRCEEKESPEEVLSSKICLLSEYYKNNLYNEGISLYDEIKNFEMHNQNNKNMFLHIINPMMYKMTNNIEYLRSSIKELDIYGYEQDLLYLALKNDFEYCKQYKDIIFQKIKEYDIELVERFKSYDILGNKIKEMACEL